MTAQDIFNLAMAHIGKISPTGAIDANKTASYRVRAPGILTSWQNEIATALGITIPDVITDLSQSITVNDRISGQYYLASNLVLVEDPASASFFQDKFEENKRLFLSRQPASITSTTDVYNLNFGSWGDAYGSD